MNRRELNNLIKEELDAAIKGHPSYLEEVEDMEAGEIEGGEEGEEDIMDALQGFYEKLKAHFEGEEGGEEKTEEEEEEIEDEEEAPEDVEEAKRGRKKSPAKKAPKEDPEGKEEEENTLNESIKRFQKLANIRG